ncbi:MAG: hypothetical protein R2861_13930 [Desulfobacterales bacterium]
MTGLPPVAADGGWRCDAEIHLPASPAPDQRNGGKEKLLYLAKQARNGHRLKSDPKYAKP